MEAVRYRLDDTNWVSSRPLSGRVVDTALALTPTGALLSWTSSERLGLDQLSGPIPSELGNLANLESAGARRQPVSGPIPSELGNEEC